jgi:ammonia channel protein AmtB
MHASVHTYNSRKTELRANGLGQSTLGQFFLFETWYIFNEKSTLQFSRKTRREDTTWETKVLMGGKY